MKHEGYEGIVEGADECDKDATPYRAGLLKISELVESGQMDLVVATTRNHFFRDLYRRGFKWDLGLRVVTHPDGTLEANWPFTEALYNNGEMSKTSKRHFHPSEHPLVQSLKPGEDWI